MSAAHSSQNLRKAGVNLDGAKAALVLIHGRGASAESILPLAAELVGEDVAVLAPQATDHSWYPRSFMVPSEQNQPHLSSALAVLADLVGQLEAKEIPSERLILAGFSQGACLASEFAARNPRRYGGLLIFSGGLIGQGPEVSADLYEGDLQGTAVFLGCSDRDAHIPLERVEASAAILEAMGAKVDLGIYPGMGHTIIEDELARARAAISHLGLKGV